MNQIFICPMCGDEITSERFIRSSVICHCGWSHSLTSKQAEARRTHSSIALLMVFAGLILGAFFHVTQWGNHSWDIIPLKVKQLSGSASPAHLYTILEICKDVGNLNCQEKTYQELYENHDDLESLVSLGQFYYLKDEFANARDTLVKYYRAGGRKMDGRFHLARAYGKLGQVAQSRQQFRAILKTKPKILQVTVTRAYVNMLLDNEEYRAAKNVILYYRKKGDNTGYFLNNELNFAKSKILAKL